MRFASNREGKVSGLPGEGTFAWTQVAVTTGLVALLSLCVLFCSIGCSRGQQQVPATQENAAAQPEAPAGPEKAGDEDLGPLVKTAWKGDLDEIAKRRVVRVLVPFRRPEFFYMDG